MVRRCASSRRLQPTSPISRASSVELTTSVNSTARRRVSCVFGTDAVCQTGVPADSHRCSHGPSFLFSLAKEGPRVTLLSSIGGSRLSFANTGCADARTPLGRTDGWSVGRSVGCSQNALTTRFAAFLPSTHRLRGVVPTAGQWALFGHSQLTARPHRMVPQLRVPAKEGPSHLGPDDPARSLAGRPC